MVGRVVHEGSARRVECDPYLGRTVGEMGAGGCCIFDPYLQARPRGQVSVHRVATSNRIVDAFLIQDLVKRGNLICNITSLEKRANIFARGLNLKCVSIDESPLNLSLTSCTSSITVRVETVGHPHCSYI